MRTNKRRLIGLLAIVVFGMVALTGRACAYSGQGTGTGGDPYLIANCVQLQEIQDNLTAAYKLANDIDCTDTSNWNGGEGFAPLGTNAAGNDSTRFTGSLDGNQHIISNLHIHNTTSGTNGAGLFGSIGTTGSVQYLGVEGQIFAQERVGALAGSNYGSINYVFTNAAVTSNGSFVGGMLGINYGTDIYNSYSMGSVSSPTGGYVGGFTGFNGGIIQNAFSTANVVGGNSVGGFMGRDWGGVITNVFASGSVTGSTAGGLIGEDNGGTVTNAHWSSTLSGQTYCKYPASNTGCTDHPDDPTYFTDRLHEPISSFPGGGSYFRSNATWGLAPTFMWHNLYNMFDSGNGIDSDPWLISSCSQLQAINTDSITLAGYYALTNNIDCSDTINWNAGLGFSPIGAGTTFSGQFDGGGHEVQHLYINRPEDTQIGLFAEIADGTTIGGVSLTDVEIHGGQATGSLIGVAYGTIDSCSATGSVDGSFEVGGLVGGNNGWDTVVNSHSEADVSGLGNVGGLVGSNYGNIYDSYSSGNVTGMDSEGFASSSIGGLVGWSTSGDLGGEPATISGSYATGSVTGSSGVGGLVGSTTWMYLDHDYATGDITVTNDSGDSIGGLGGSIAYTYVVDSYATGDIDAPSAQSVGGLIGYGVIAPEHSYATGNVHGGLYVGGYAGTLDCQGASAVTSFSMGAVTADEAAGGFAGSIMNCDQVTDSYTTSNVTSNGFGAGFASIIDSGSFYNLYATGAVHTAEGQGAGFTNSVGANGVVSAVFWDTQTTGQNDSAAGLGKTSSQMKTLATFTDELGESAWNFEDTWLIDGGTNNGYPCLRWSEVSCSASTDSDGDGQPDSLEDAGPNGGDANGDHIPDSEQANVLTYMNPVSSQYAVLETDCLSIANFQVGGESAEKPDTNYTYPFGLVSFHITCANPGDTATIRQYFYGVEGSDNYSVRKWTSDGGYREISGYHDLGTPINGDIVFLVQYQITDGGQYDDDGSVNALIVDPSGAALPVTSSGAGSSATNSSLASSGDNIIYRYLLLSLLLGTTGAYIIASNHRRIATHHGKKD